MTRCDRAYWCPRTITVPGPLRPISCHIARIGTSSTKAGRRSGRTRITGRRTTGTSHRSRGTRCCPRTRVPAPDEGTERRRFGNIGCTGHDTDVYRRPRDSATGDTVRTPTARQRPPRGTGRHAFEQCSVLRRATTSRRSPGDMERRSATIGCTTRTSQGRWVGTRVCMDTVRTGHITVGTVGGRAGTPGGRF